MESRWDSGNRQPSVRSVGSVRRPAKPRSQGPMKLETFFEKFDQFADAPNAVAKMRAHVRERQRPMREPQPRGRERQRRSIIQPRVGATQERLPWDCQKKHINPNGVASSGARWMQPFQGWLRGGRVPRVARSSQPWAGRWNPVGIRETANPPSNPSGPSAA